MPQLKIDLRRPAVRLPDALPEGLRDTVEHLPERVQADVVLPDVKLAAMKEIARGVAERAPDRLPTRAEIVDRLPDRMPTRSQIIDALPPAVAERLPVRPRRRSPVRLILGALAVTGIAAAVMRWARVQPWLEARIADARAWFTAATGGATDGALDDELEAFPAATRAPIAPSPYAEELRPGSTGLSSSPGELPAGIGSMAGSAENGQS